MAFNPASLPETVQEAYRLGPSSWGFVVQRAVICGIESLDKLTDIVFFLHHPERKGKSLASNEISLIAEWNTFRDLIAPRIRDMVRFRDDMARRGNDPVREGLNDPAQMFQQIMQQLTQGGG
jgi:hypothetical protein